MFEEGWTPQLCQAGTTRQQHHRLPPPCRGLCAAPLLLHISWMAWTPFPAHSPCFLAWGSLCLSPCCACCPLSPGLLAGPLQTALGSICCGREPRFSHAAFVPWWKDGPSAKLRSLPACPSVLAGEGSGRRQALTRGWGGNSGLPMTKGGHIVPPSITGTSSRIYRAPSHGGRKSSSFPLGTTSLVTGVGG